MNPKTPSTASSKSAIRTIYLVPHSHTDIGFTHDPLATIELHDRFLDRAIALCEATRHFPDGSRFRWTVEVIFSALHWWEQRGAEQRGRLVECLRRGEIEVGARYLNGTELYAPEDIDWELAELERWAGCCGTRPRVAIQNDVNGFPLPMARKLSTAGVDTLMMGLNTTMGHSPFPRCTAFRWDIGEGDPWLVWNGWIYNRIKMFCHLDELADRFQERAEAFLASLPPDYPYDFAMTNATVDDNAGPFPSLPEQVRRFNEKSTGLELKLATFGEVAGLLRGAAAPVAAHRGAWPDFWTFGAGSMPQWVEMTRRAQRRLRLVEAFRKAGWASESGGSLGMDIARRALAMACEHTYGSHTTAGEETGSTDSLRQMAQMVQAAASAETASMVLLRDHLAAMAANCAKTPVSVMVANPHPFPLRGGYYSQEKGLLTWASSRRPEHLFQFDREPTFEALAKSGTFGCTELDWPARAMRQFPLGTLPPRETTPIEAGATADLDLGHGRLCVHHQTVGAFPSLDWRSAEGDSIFAPAAEYPAFSLVEERPLTPFQVGTLAGMDPLDEAWNPDLRFERRVVPFAGGAYRVAGADGVRIVFEQSCGLLRRIEFAPVPGHPGALMVTVSLHYDADPAVRAFYLPIPFEIPGTGNVDYWVDSCGTPYRAGSDQLPGTCTSFYHVFRGVAVQRERQTVYVVSPDITLFQCGGFTFGQPPTVSLQRRRPWIAAWLYNNYWNTNFPAYSPGWARARFLLQVDPGEFDVRRMQQLDAVFDRDYLTHPVA